jgi:hypothetical protein
MYISEISPPNVRGAFLVLSDGAIVFGIVVMFYLVCVHHTSGSTSGANRQPRVRGPGSGVRLTAKDLWHPIHRLGLVFPPPVSHPDHSR